MARYYFDYRDDKGFSVDDEGFELPDLAAVQWEAVLSLVDQSRRTAKGSMEGLTDLVIDVRDDAGPVMQVAFKLYPRGKN
jgi:hypothetical protein